MFKIDEFDGTEIEDFIQRREHQAFSKGVITGLKFVFELGFNKQNFEILRHLISTNGNVSETARKVGMPRTTVQYRIKKFKMIYKIINR